VATVARSRFHLLFGVAVTALVFAGFAQSYYLAFLFDARPLTILLHVHGLVFSAWLVVFILQTRFIATNRYLLHRRLGIAGAALAGAVVVVGVLTAMILGTLPGVRALGLDTQRFMIVPLIDIALFAGFVGSALALRRRPQWHRRLMVLGMIAILAPAVARILLMLSVPRLFMVAQAGVVIAFLAWAVANDWLRYRIVHPAYLLGGAMILLSWPLRIAVARSDAWSEAARVLARLGASLIG
jgi:hypothetical protein